jgi:hypothetical protein
LRLFVRTSFSSTLWTSMMSVPTPKINDLYAFHLRMRGVAAISQRERRPLQPWSRKDGIVL